MSKVPRNKGSYTRRANDSYQVKYPLGWSDRKRKYDEYIETVESEAEAISLIKEINDYVYHGGLPASIAEWRKGASDEEDRVALTLGEFADSFIRNREKQGSVATRTLQSDRECFNRIRPYLGDSPLVDIGPQDIETAYANMRSGGKENLSGRVYAGTTLQKTHVFLSMLFDRAVDYGYLDRNPCSRVCAPRRDTKEKMALASEEARSLFSCIAGEKLEPRAVGVLLALSCGLRLSEMLALKWSDYRNGAISVTKSLNREKQTYKKTKNGESRVVPCPSALSAVLLRWKDVQRTWFADQGLQWSEDAPIVNSSVGNHILQRSYTRWFGHARLRYPIPDDFTFHGLRHTYVTFLSRDCSVDARTARSMSGHRSSQAFSIYTHTNRHWQEIAAERLGSIIAPTEEEMRCRGCRYWSASPEDSAKGACWAHEGRGLVVRRAEERCSIDSFSARPKAG